ncbi:hypothetical protein [Flavivirga eckloniae]|nr:hypothetical protein [Flavivirga eckloniae]
MVETKLEHILTNSYKADMIAYMKSHPEDFEEAIKLAISNKPPYSWRAAWLLWSCMEKNDQRILKYVDIIIDTIPTTSDEQARELLIILQHMELTNDNEGKLFNICINIWEKIGKQPSFRYNAFKLMIKIIKNHPDLYKEIAFLTESHYTDSLSDNVKKSIFKMVIGLKKRFKQ